MRALAREDFAERVIYPLDCPDYLLRPDRRADGMRYLFDHYVLDAGRRELRRGDAAPISIEPQVFDLLVYLIQNRDRVVSKDDLIAGVWHGRIVSDSTLTSRIKRPARQSATAASSRR